MNDTNQRLSADDVEALLPWYAAGTLDAWETEQVEAAVAADATLARRLDLVREEMTEAIVLNEALEVPSARVAEKLFRTIDEERRTGRAPAARGGLSGFLANLLSPRSYALVAGAAVLVIVLEAGFIAKLLLLDRTPTGSYETASMPPGGQSRGLDLGASVRVKFAPQANMMNVSRFLHERDAMITDGPLPGDLYRVHIARKEDLDRLVKEFQAASRIIASADAD